MSSLVVELVGLRGLEESKAAAKHQHLATALHETLTYRSAKPSSDRV